MEDEVSIRKYFELISDRLKSEGDQTVSPYSPHYLYFKAKIVEIDQWIMRGTDIVTEARLVVATLSRNGRPRRMPGAWREKLEPLMDNEK